MDAVMQAGISLFGASLGYAAGQNTSAVSMQTANALGTQGADINAASSAPQTPFADLMVDAVSDVGKLQAQARDAVEGLMSGRGVDVHRAMIASSEAEAGFELVLAVRNKALAAYQQVMGMQF